MPAYNSADTLEEALRSVLDQTHTNIEVLLVDDGSTDGTVALFRESGLASRVRLLSQEHRGAPAARNTGRAEARGEFLLFVDSDDVLRPTLIERYVDALRAHPDAAYAYCDFAIRLLDPTFRGDTFISREFDSELLRHTNYIDAVSLVRTSACPDWDPALRSLQDWDLWLTMLDRGHSGVHIPEVLFETIDRKDSITRKFSRENYSEALADVRSKHQRVLLMVLDLVDSAKASPAWVEALRAGAGVFTDLLVVPADVPGVGSCEAPARDRAQLGMTAKLVLRGAAETYDYVVLIEAGRPHLPDGWLREALRIATFCEGRVVLLTAAGDAATGTRSTVGCRLLGRRLERCLRPEGGAVVISGCSLGQIDLLEASISATVGSLVDAAEQAGCLTLQMMSSGQSQSPHTADVEVVRVEAEPTTLRVRIIAASEVEIDPAARMMWGDHWLRCDLEDAFRRAGHIVVDSAADASLVLYLFGYPPARLGYTTFPRGSFNAVWIHSHPDLVDAPQLSTFDRIYCQSSVFAARLRARGLEVTELMGAAAKRAVESTPDYDVVFVGNARPEFAFGRAVIRDLGDQPWDVRIWGDRWEDKVPARYLQGRYYPNNQLARLYARSKIVLNDHHEDMAREGFVSFRVFDALAAGALVISDRSPGVTQVFGDTVPQYESASDLHDLVDHFLHDEQHRRDLARRGQAIALRYPFDRLVAVIARDAAGHQPRM
jgi:hypothetical protein